MSDEIIVQQCSPTLAGLKTGNMFTCPFENEMEMTINIRKWNDLQVKKGLRVLPLRFHDGNALIYVFRPSSLTKDLKDCMAYRLLQERGYTADIPDRCVIELIKKFGECEEFPHEIGLFLGYPPEDVNGFIENKADGYKCVGFWKVYGDVKKARKLFAKYKRCTDKYCYQFSKGRGIESLAVVG